MAMKTVNFMIEPEDWEAVRVAAAREGMGMSEWLRKLIARRLKRQLQRQ